MGCLPSPFSNQWITYWKDKLTDNRQKILELMYENDQITKEELSNKIGIGSTAVDNNIKWLRENDLILREGSDRSGRWKLLLKL